MHAITLMSSERISVRLSIAADGNKYSLSLAASPQAGVGCRGSRSTLCIGQESFINMET